MGEGAFGCCRLVHIDIPPSVRAIKNWAFSSCSELTTAILNDGLVEIGRCVFANCRSLVGINIPPSVKAIKNGAFYNCLQLVTVILNDGLEKIGKEAFYKCALVRIVIPPSVRAIEWGAFKECSNLTTIQFCNEIEEFVSAELMQHWWSNGVHEKCLRTYCFFIRCSIPKRVGLV